MRILINSITFCLRETTIGGKEDGTLTIKKINTPHDYLLFIMFFSKLSLLILPPVFRRFT